MLAANPSAYHGRIRRNYRHRLANSIRIYSHRRGKFDECARNRHIDILARMQRIESMHIPDICVPHLRYRLRRMGQDMSSFASLLASASALIVDRESEFS